MLEPWWRRGGVMGPLTLLAVFVLFTCPAQSEDPDSAVVRCQKLIEAGDFPAARAELAAVLKQFPAEPRLHNLSGVVEAQHGTAATAEAAFRKAVQLAPRFTGAYLNLGRLYQENSGLPDALTKGIATYRSVLAYDAANTEANYQIAILLERQGAYGASLLHLDKLPSAAAQRPQALALRCAAYAGSGQLARSLDTAHRLAAASGLTEEDVLPILPGLIRRNAPAAIELLEALRKRSLASGESLRRLGLLYEERRRYSDAISALESATSASGAASAPVLLDLARIAYKQGDRKASLGYLAHARDVDPGNAGIHFSFGAICLQLNLPLDAIESLRKAVQLDPENPAYNYAIGAVLAQGKDPGEAIPYLQKYAGARKGDPHGRFALAFAYFSSAQYELARREFEAIAGRPATAAGAHYFLGRMALMDGDGPKAFSELRQAIAADSKYADAHAELGLYYLENRDYAKAGQELRHALELDPDGLRANLNLLTLYRRTRDPRATAQATRFEEVQKKRWEKQLSLLRRVVVQPY